MQLIRFHEQLQQLSTAVSVDQLTAMCLEQARVLGFDHVVYALRSPTRFTESRLIMVDAYPDGWVRHYLRQANYVSDPVIAYCTRNVAPVKWSELRTEPGSAAERVMNEAREFGLHDGISMPVHGPHGEQGILSLTTRGGPAHADDVTRHSLPYAPLMATFLHDALRRVSGLMDDPQRPALTERELDCLRWAADGKTSGEIAQLLTLTESTINFHFGNAVRKLDVSSRQHAVARAALQGYLRPMPF
ncbi:MAG: LuxR family transcriptional regulator [Gammaproteobacteria bacterium]